MQRLYLHRVEPARKDGRFVLEKVPERPECENCGVKYRLAIEQLGSIHAKAYGWSTGYPLPCDEGPIGRVYAPMGFKKGNIAYVQMDDFMVSAAEMENFSIEGFIDNLEKGEAVASVIRQLKQFSLVGEIMYDV